MNNIIPWGHINPAENDISISLGTDVNLVLKADEKELRLYQSDSESKHILHRFVTGPGSKVFIDPGMPDLPVVIKPESELTIMPGKSLSAFVDVPVVMQLHWRTAKKRQLLKEYPFRDLSRSWFGDPDNGEIAYFLESPFYCDYREYEPGGCCVYCPVTIINKSIQPLKLERMILRLPYLSIYKGESLFFSGRTTITFRGQDKISQLSFSKHAPEINEELRLVSPPRQTEDNGVLSKSFYFIKTLYQG